MGKFIPGPEHDLYSEALKPIEQEKKSVNAFGMGIIWFGLGVQITVFLTLSPLLQYYTISEFIIASVIGQATLIIIGCLIWDIGMKYDISFATSISSAFGSGVGGKLAGVLRILPGLFFFGTNGFLGASALNEISKQLFGFDCIWLYIIINAALLIYVCSKGSKGIEIFAKIATPLMLVITFYLGWVVLHAYDTSLMESLSIGRLGTPRTLMYGICVTIGGYTAVVIGMNDYSKDFKISKEDVEKGWWHRNKKFLIWSLVLGVIGYTVISTIALTCVALTGVANPLEMITQMVGANSVLLAVLVQLFIFVAQLSTNSGANLYPAVYVLCSFAPKKINTLLAAVIFGGLSIALRPWTLSNMDTVYMVIGCFAGPLFAVIIVDYYIFRKQKLSIDNLYKTRGKYYYAHGFNIPAFITFVAATVLGVFFPDYAFLLSAGFGAILYYFLAKAFSSKYPVLTREEESDDI